jgi:hypothetical protein
MKKTKQVYHTNASINNRGNWMRGEWVVGNSYFLFNLSVNLKLL